MKDQKDRTPLHYACANPHGLIGGSSWQKRSSSQGDTENMFQIISSLTRAYPEATQIPDISGKTSIVLAVENKADHRIVSVLANAAGRLRMKTFSSPELDLRSFEMSQTIASDCSPNIFFVSLNNINNISSVSSGGISHSCCVDVPTMNGKKKKQFSGDTLEI